MSKLATAPATPAIRAFGDRKNSYLNVLLLRGSLEKRELIKFELARVVLIFNQLIFSVAL